MSGKKDNALKLKIRNHGCVSCDEVDGHKPGCPEAVSEPCWKQVAREHYALGIAGIEEPGINTRHPSYICGRQIAEQARI